MTNDGSKTTPEKPAALFCRRCFVSGRVQGVFFRASTAEQARRLGITGWARNLPDGRVEVLACGSEEALGKLTAWLRVGPRGARVEHVETEAVGGAEMPFGFGIR